MGNNDQSMRATAGRRRVVVAHGEPGDGFGELRGERGAFGCRAKTDFGVDGERREMFALFLGAADEIRDLAHDARAEGDQVARREPIGGSGRIAGHISKRGRRYDVRRGRGDEASLDQSAPSSFFDGPNQSMRLERTEVVVHLLTRKPHAVCERRRRSGLRELRQEASADGIERHHGDGGIVDDFEVENGLHGFRLDH